MPQGWISVHRSIWDSWVWRDKPFSKGQAWIDLILMANHEDKKTMIGNQLIVVERGKFITSEVKLSDRWGWSRKKVREFLRLLESDKMLTKKATTKYTAITIENYAFYQDMGTSKEQQKNSNGTSKEQQKNTNNNENNDNKEKYITAQNLFMSKKEYEKLADKFGKRAVDEKIEYARNYKKLKNYTSLYLTLNNWLKREGKEQGPLGIPEEVPKPSGRRPENLLERVKAREEAERRGQIAGD